MNLKNPSPLLVARGSGGRRPGRGARSRLRWRAWLAPFGAAALLPGCAQVPTLPGITPYKIEIQQGNFVSQEMMSKLKPGMTRDQVRFVLGTPLVSDIFHPNRWDYVYARRAAGGGKSEQRHFAVFFEDDKLHRIEGDIVPKSTPESGDRGDAAQ